MCPSNHIAEGSFFETRCSPPRKFFFFFQFVYFSEDSCLNWGVILNFAEFLSVGNQSVLLFCSSLLVRSSSISYVVRFVFSCGFLLKIAVSAGLMNLDCFRVNTRNSVIFLFLFILDGDSVLFVNLAATCCRLLVNFSMIQEDSLS